LSGHTHTHTRKQTQFINCSEVVGKKALWTPHHIRLQVEDNRSRR